MLQPTWKEMVCDDEGGVGGEEEETEIEIESEIEISFLEVLLLIESAKQHTVALQEDCAGL
jgi:hypothetical protein